MQVTFVLCLWVCVCVCVRVCVLFFVVCLFVFWLLEYSWGVVIMVHSRELYPKKYGVNALYSVCVCVFWYLLFVCFLTTGIQLGCWYNGTFEGTLSKEVYNTTAVNFCLLLFSILLAWSKTLLYIFITISGNVLLLDVLQRFWPGPERRVQDSIRSKTLASAKDSQWERDTICRHVQCCQAQICSPTQTEELMMM